MKLQILLCVFLLPWPWHALPTVSPDDYNRDPDKGHREKV